MGYEHHDSISAFIQLMESRPSLFSGRSRELERLEESLIREISKRIEAWCEARPDIFSAYVENVRALCLDKAGEHRGGIGGVAHQSREDEKEEPKDPVIHLLNLIRRTSQTADRDSETGKPEE